MYDTFINKWNGRQVTKFSGECVAVVAEYEAENNLPIVWGNAVDWINNPIMLSAYDWVENDPNDPNQLPPRGAIIVWNGNLPGSGGFGHIAFYDSAINTGVFQSFGQNYGGPTAHFQAVTWSWVAGWYIEKEVAKPLATPDPAAANVEVYPYLIEVITPKQVQTNKLAMKWGMHYDNLTAIEANPEGSRPKDDIFTVVAICHHNIGYNYYLEDANIPSGYDVLDCDDYVQILVPAPPPVSPPPYIPPAAPVPIPSSTVPYPILTEIPGFAQIGDAMLHENPVTVIKPAKDVIWYKYTEKNGMLYVTRTPSKGEFWIDPADNVIPSPKPPSTGWTKPRDDTSHTVNIVVAPPKVDPILKPSEVKAGNAADSKWKATWKPFNVFNQSVPYELKQDVLMLDYSGARRSVQLYRGNKVNVIGTFEKNGVTFYRLRDSKDEFFSWFYGISQVDDDGNAVLVKVPTSQEQIATPKLSDFLHYWKDDIKNIMDIFIVRKIKK